MDDGRTEFGLKQNKQQRKIISVSAHRSDSSSPFLALINLLVASVGTAFFPHFI